MSLRLFLCRLATLLLALPLLSACGGGGSSSSESSTSSVATQIVKGYVEDGPIAGATVELRYFDATENEYVTAYFCGASGRGACLAPATGEDGSFSFTVNAFANLPELVVSARGGIDRMTGEPFTELPMRSSLKLFPGQNMAVTVSPLTTLMTGEIEQGASPAEAQERVRSWLQLPSSLNLNLRPSLAARTMQPVALVLTHLAKEKTDTDDPFCALKAATAGPLFDAAGEISTQALAPFFSQAKVDHFRAFYRQLREAAPEKVGPLYRKVAIKQALGETFAELFADESDFTPDDSRYLLNLDLLTDRVLAAAEGTTLPLDDVVPARIARYVAFVYNLSAYQSLLQDSVAFANMLVRLDENGAAIALEEDPRIAFLADLKARYSVEVPVQLTQVRKDLKNEAAEEGLVFPAGFLDEPKNLLAAYYYRSDLSPFYDAERLIAEVNNADVNDAIMLEVVKAKAAAGLQVEVEKLLRGDAIIQSGYRGDGWKAFGEILSEFGHREKALQALMEAESLYRNMIASKGAANLDREDAQNLQHLADAYAELDMQKEEALIDYFLSLTDHLIFAADFGKLFVAVRDHAEDRLEKNMLIEAREVVDKLHRLALKTPANDNDGLRYLKLYVFHLVETAKLYAQLGEADKVWEIYAHIERIRVDDGLENLTRNETWFYMSDMVRVLYLAGYSRQALALADAIPKSYENSSGRTISGESYREKALKEVATFIALEEGNERAFSFLEETFSDDRDKIEVLTYFAANKSHSFIGQSHIDRQQLGEARQALDMALVLLEEMNETLDVHVYMYLVNYGYAKLADLFHHAGSPQQAMDLLDTGVGIAEGIGDPRWRSLALQSIAEAYQQIGSMEAAQQVLDSIMDLLAHSEGFSREQYRLNTYRLVLKSYRSMPDEQLWQDFLRRVRGVYSEGGAYGGTDHDDLADLEAEHLILAADFLSGLARKSLPLTAEIYRTQALALLDEAWAVSSRIYVDETRYERHFGKQVEYNLVEGYARAGDFTTAKAVAEAIPYRERRHEALQGLAEIYCKHDAFPETTAARVDTDSDGAPDFFAPLAGDGKISASGLVVDEDSDGDGIPDLEDSRPLLFDTFRRN